MGRSLLKNGRPVPKDKIAPDHMTDLTTDDSEQIEEFYDESKQRSYGQRLWIPTEYASIRPPLSQIVIPVSLQPKENPLNCQALIDEWGETPIGGHFSAHEGLWNMETNLEEILHVICKGIFPATRRFQA